MANSMDRIGLDAMGQLPPTTSTATAAIDPPPPPTTTRRASSGSVPGDNLRTANINRRHYHSQRQQQLQPPQPQRPYEATTTTTTPSPNYSYYDYNNDPPTRSYSPPDHKQQQHYDHHFHPQHYPQQQQQHQHDRYPSHPPPPKTPQYPPPPQQQQQQVYHHNVRVEAPRRQRQQQESDYNLQQLKKQGFSRGLSRSLLLHAQVFAERHWVIDNSGSMVIGDGHRIVETSDRKIVEQAVSRWEEIQDTVLYHSQMAALLESPTVFHLLNDPGTQVGLPEFSVAQDPNGDVEREIRMARTIMQRAKPTGVTPLTDHVWQLRELVQRMEPQLRQTGKRVAIIIATDGLPTDSEGYGGDDVLQEFVQALKSLEGLPVWLVIRLCTDEQKVTSFYNGLDTRLELSLEVLDDFLGEAREVKRYNPWLNYAVPLHRCRELGYHDRLLDLIDERPLTKGELRDFCANLFGTDVEVVPDPNMRWKDFCSYIDEQLRMEQHQYDPIRKKFAPWVHLKVLQRYYGKGKCTIM